MADFRIGSLNSYGNLLDYEGYTIVDKNSYSYSRKVNVSAFANDCGFKYIYDNFYGDFVYYKNQLNTIFGNYFKINDNNTNIKFTKNQYEYTPSAASYTITTNSQGDYGDYFSIDRYEDDLDISYIIEPNYYTKPEIDEFLSECNFDINSDQSILEISTASNVGNYYKKFTIVNSALYANSSNYSFNPFVSSYGEKTSGTFVLGDLYDNNHGGNSGNIFVINKKDKLAYYYSPNVLSINGGSYNSNTGGNHFSIIGSGIDLLSFGRSNFSIIGGDKEVDNEKRPNYSIQITQNPNYDDLDNYKSCLVLGDWNNKTLYCNYVGNFEFNVSSEYGFYIDGNKIFVGTMKDKFPDMSMYLPGEYISFGDNIDGKVKIHKFSIGGNYDNYDSHTIFEMNNNLTGVFYKGVNIAERKDDVYETSSYWDLVMNKDKLERDVFYTY